MGAAPEEECAEERVGIVCRGSMRRGVGSPGGAAAALALVGAGTNLVLVRGNAEDVLEGLRMNEGSAFWQINQTRHTVVGGSLQFTSTES